MVVITVIPWFNVVELMIILTCCLIITAGFIVETCSVMQCWCTCWEFLDPCQTWTGSFLALSPPSHQPHTFLHLTAAASLPVGGGERPGALINRSTARCITATWKSFLATALEVLWIWLAEVQAHLPEVSPALFHCEMYCRYKPHDLWEPCLPQSCDFHL